MVIDHYSSTPWKRRRLTGILSMEAESAKAKLAAAKERFGREIRVFETIKHSESPNDVPSTEVSDDFYEFTAEDYYRMMSNKKEDKFLKTKKIREQEEAARRSKITKAVIRVRFPDNHTLEVTFHPSEKIQCLVDLVMKVVARPDLPFYLYTTPPKKQIKDMSQDFYAAGFIPGAVVYFANDLPKSDATSTDDSGHFLQEEIMSLKGLEVIAEQEEAVQTAPTPEPAAASPSVSTVTQQPKSEGKKPIKPKWFKR